MSDLGLDLEHGRAHRRSRKRRRSGPGCLAAVIALVLLVGGGYLAITFAVDEVKDRFSGPEDYAGPGTGSVMVEVREGDAASQIGATLESHDVVKSQEAFTEAAVAEPASRSIQVGFYELKKKMAAEDALEVLIDPENLVQNAVAFPEGWTVEQIVEELAEKTDFSAKEFKKVLRRPESIGLPSYAGGNPEGYLFPATYQLKPNATPESILTRMVDRYKEAAATHDLKAEAKEIGVSPHDVMTVASLIQAEARFDKDFAKVSRVIYNRIEEPMPLQFDSTVHYAVGKDGAVGTSDADRDVDSPYNTYKVRGLPPTPINAPGEQAIEAALNPVDGPWLYFVTTDPDSGETKFAETYEEHQKNVEEFQEWCSQSENC